MAPLTPDLLALVARRFRMLGEPIRLRMLQCLESGPLSVNELAEKLQSTQSNISRHLSAMHGAGLLDRRREGNSTFYSVGDPLVVQLCELVCNSAREQTQQLAERLGVEVGSAKPGRRRP